jgi:hypothetical protein
MQQSNSWHAVQPPAKPYGRVVTFVVARAPLVRRDVEDAFVAGLNARGVFAVSSSDYLPETRKADRAAFDACLKNTRADAVLITRLARVERRDQASAAPRAQPVPPLPPGVASLYDYYAWAWGQATELPEVFDVDSITAESRLFDTATGQVVWAGATRAIQRTKNQKNDAGRFAGAVIDELAGLKLVPGPVR